MPTLQESVSSSSSNNARDSFNHSPTPTNTVSIIPVASSAATTPRSSPSR